MNLDNRQLDDVVARFNQVPVKVRTSPYFGSTKRYLGARNPDNTIPWPDLTSTTANELGLGEHFQGIQRIGKHLFLSAGIKTGTRRSQLIVIEMGSRPAQGPWSLPKYGSYKRPLPEDKIVKVLDVDRDRWHAGGIQALGDVVALPIYGGQAGSEIRYFNCANPAAPVELSQMRLVRTDVKSKAVALIRLPDDYFMTMIWDDRYLDFHLSKSRVFTNGFTPDRKRVLPSQVTGGFQPGGGGASGAGTYQQVTFLRDTSGGVFLVGARNLQKGSPTFPGADFADLYRVTWPGNAYDQVPAIEFISHRQFYCYNQQCNFGAGAGVYVDDAQHVFLYAASHWLHGGNTRFNFNEYAPP